MGQSPPSDTYNKEGVGLPFFQGKTEFGRRYPKIKMYCSSPKKTATENDILMSVRAPVGPVNIANNDCCIGRGLCAIRSSDKLDFMYLYHFLKANELKISSKGTGSTFTAINKKTIHELEIPLPPLQTQKKIVAILEKAERLKEWRKDSDELTDEFLKSTFLEMFGNPAINPKGFDVVQLNTVYSKDKHGTKCGPFGSALKKDEYVDFGIPVWTMDNILNNEFIEDGSLYISPEKYQQLIPYLVEKGDIIISRAGTVGKMCVVSPPVHPSIISTNLIRLSLDFSKIEPIYFTSLMTRFKGRVGRLKTGDDGAYSFMNTGVLNELQIALPPIELQQKFASIVQQVEQLREHQSQSRQHIDDLFNVLMQKAFKGELV